MDKKREQDFKTKKQIRFDAAKYIRLRNFLEKQKDSALGELERFSNMYCADMPEQKKAVDSIKNCYDNLIAELETAIEIDLDKPLENEE